MAAAPAVAEAALVAAPAVEVSAEAASAAARAPVEALAVPVPEDSEVPLVIITIITVPILVGALVRAAITAEAEDALVR